jgi:hypothetical protein
MAGFSRGFCYCASPLHYLHVHRTDSCIVQKVSESKAQLHVRTPVSYLASCDCDGQSMALSVSPAQRLYERLGVTKRMEKSTLRVS